MIAYKNPYKVTTFPPLHQIFQHFFAQKLSFTNLDTPLYIVLTQIPSADAQALLVARVKTSEEFEEHYISTIGR